MSAQLLETITECLAQSQSESMEVQLKALQTLSYLTKVSPQNRNLLAQAADAIPVLLALTKSSSSTAHIFSLSILFSISLNPNLRQSLAKMDTIDHLNSIILTPTSPESRKLAASLICSLAMLDKNKAAFGVAGTIQALVETLKGPLNPSAHHLLSSLAELVQFHGNGTLAVRAGAVPVLFDVVKSTEGEDLAGSALAVLGFLVRFDEGIEEVRKTQGVVELLVEVLKRRCMLSKEGSAELLLRLFEDWEEFIEEAMGLPEFSSAVADLSVRGSSKAREKATLLMRKMMEANLDGYLESNPTLLL